MIKKKNIKWTYDPILSKDGLPSKSILYGKSSSLHFIITTHPNRILSKPLVSSKLVYLEFINKFHRIHLYRGTLTQMKSLAQQIVNNEKMFYRLQYLEPYQFIEYDGPEDDLVSSNRIPIEKLYKL